MRLKSKWHHLYKTRNVIAFVYDVALFMIKNLRYYIILVVRRNLIIHDDFPSFDVNEMDKFTWSLISTLKKMICHYFLEHFFCSLTSINVQFALCSLWWSVVAFPTRYLGSMTSTINNCSTIVQREYTLWSCNSSDFQMAFNSLGSVDFFFLSFSFFCFEKL